ncbi:restriction endonuclease (plasmid) [Alicyclobacillus curvatus]|nr:restriction endonuclease [Alicyclobacillus curvatus]
MNITSGEWEYIGLLFGGIISGIGFRKIDTMSKRSKRSRGSAGKKTTQKIKKTGKVNAHNSAVVRSDDIILRTSLEKLGYNEFEKLLVLYFSDSGYEVEHVGKGGRDRGVDLVLTDTRTRERIAVQAKHYSYGPVGPETVRALRTSQSYYSCVESILITSNDITAGAREEAERWCIKCWHGTALTMRLERWGKWSPKKHVKKKA